MADHAIGRQGMTVVRAGGPADNEVSMGKAIESSMEKQAIKDARRPFAEILTELGLMEHFFDLSAEAIDRLIEAAVDGFQQSMQCQALNDDVPW